MDTIDIGFDRRHQHHHQQELAFTFNYVYTCDIEGALFRVKIGTLDGILPPNINPNSSGGGGGNPNNSNNEKEKHSTTKYTTVQNHYEYNIVEDSNNFSFFDELISSSDEFDEDSNPEDTTSGIESDDLQKHQSSSFLHPNSKLLNKNQHFQEMKRKQKKKKKLAEIIFGSLNQPFRALSSHPYLTCDLVSNGKRLCPPQQTQYKQMSNRYEWNEWLIFSLTLDTLPRNTMVCFTVWDTIVPGKICAVARTSISLFSKRGCMRKGIYDLRLFFNEDCEEYFNNLKNNLNNNQSNNNKIINNKTKSNLNRQQPQQQNISNNANEITLNDINLINRKHRNEEFLLNEKEFLPKLKKHLNLIIDNYNNNDNNNDTTTSHNFNPQLFLLKKQNIENFNPNQLAFQSTEEYFQQNLSYYPIGTLDKSKKIQKLNKLKKRYLNNQMPKLDWLDRLTFSKIEHAMVKDKSLSTHVFLTIEFPTIMMDGIEHTAVYFEDKDDQCCQYDIIDKDIVVIQDPEINLPNLVESKHHALARSARSGISLRDLKPNATTRNQLNSIVNYPSTQPLSNEEQDLIWKFRFYLRNQKKALAKFLKTVNWNSASEAQQAIDLMQEWQPMDIEDALELFSPYFQHPAVRKYAVSRLKEAGDDELLLYLLQLVQALKYENFQEIRQSFENELFEYQQLQQQQQQQASETSGVDSSLPNTTTTSTSSDTIDGNQSKSSQKDVSSNNSNKNGNKSTNTATNIINQEDLATFLLNRACSNNELANYFFWYLCVECEGSKSLGSTTSGGGTSSSSSSSTLHSTVEKLSGVGNPTAVFPNVISSSVVTNSYLIPPPAGLISTTGTGSGTSTGGTETLDPQQKSIKSTSSSIQELSLSYSINNCIDMYMIMMKRFSTRLLCGSQEMTERRNFLLRQQDFVVKLVEIMKEVARESGNRLKKIDKLQSILSCPEPQFRFNFNKNDPLPSPLNPNIKLVGVIAKEAILYKSATMPAKLAFQTLDGNIFYTIFKNGDDLRQDDLVLQMINLMDKLLRKENLDLKLTPYRVLACSSKNGFVQFIDSQSVAEVISQDGSIQNFLKKISQQHLLTTQALSITATSSSIHDFQMVTTSGKHHPGNKPSQQGGSSGSGSSSSGGVSGSGSNSNIGNFISPEIMDAYIKSCAGYCVITYLLGVGDRHLDNLMLTKTGRLFHIDFGFILGRDPKVRPPPMKITREMVDAMGGMDSDNFSKFCSLVRTAFLHLRRHANLILNLFSLMIDANVPDIALEPDKTVQKVQDKFKLELDDEQADHYITEQVEQSVRSIMPVVVDQLHKMTQYLRN